MSSKNTRAPASVSVNEYFVSLLPALNQLLGQIGTAMAPLDPTGLAHSKQRDADGDVPAGLTALSPQNAARDQRVSFELGAKHSGTMEECVGSS